MKSTIFTTTTFRNKENVVAAALLIIAVVFRIIEVFLRSFDSDEPQHLHVIWGWAHGYVQYRDVFDNHAPFFHLLFTPLFALVPEWYGSIYMMRLAVIPFYFLTLVCVYLIGRKLYSHRSGLWAVILLALFNEFLTKMLEFRPDCVWTALLTLSVYILVSNSKLTRVNSLLLGMVLGTALSVSFKTIIFLIALMIALIVTWVVDGDRESFISKEKVTNLGIAVFGFLIMPALIVIGFYFLNALPELYYGVIKHNTLAHSSKALDFDGIRHKTINFFLWVLAIPIVTRLINKASKGMTVSRNRLLVLCVGMLYFAILYTFWPLVTPQTELPGLPLLVVSITPFLTGDLPLSSKILFNQSETKTNSKAWVSLMLLVSLGITECYYLIKGIGAVKNHKIQGSQLWKDVLIYTDPDDYVMDAKGETIFRKRPYYYGLETITMQLVSSGTIPDNATESLTAKPTYVVAAKYFYRYPGKLKSFVTENYLPTDTLYVAGKQLSKHGFVQHQPVQFNMLLPGLYAFVSNGKLVPGELDGVSGSGVFDIESGSHEFTPAINGADLAIVWSKAWERGIQLKESKS